MQAAPEVHGVPVECAHKEPGYNRYLPSMYKRYLHTVVCKAGTCELCTKDVPSTVCHNVCKEDLLLLSSQHHHTGMMNYGHYDSTDAAHNVQTVIVRGTPSISADGKMNSCHPDCLLCHNMYRAARYCVLMLPTACYCVLRQEGEIEGPPDRKDDEDGALATQAALEDSAAGESFPFSPPSMSQYL